MEVTETDNEINYKHSYEKSITVNKQPPKTETKTRPSTKNLITSIVIGIIIIVILRDTLNPNGQTLSFTKIIQFFMEIQNYQINWVQLGDFTINADWGVLDGLRILLNNIMSIINLAVWLCQSLINVLITILNGLRILIFE